MEYPLAAAYKTPASTAAFTCIASYMAKPISVTPPIRISRNGVISANSIAAVPESLWRPIRAPNPGLVRVMGVPVYSTRVGVVLPPDPPKEHVDAIAVPPVSVTSLATISRHWPAPLPMLAPPSRAIVPSGK